MPIDLSSLFLKLTPTPGAMVGPRPIAAWVRGNGVAHLRRRSAPSDQVTLAEPLATRDVGIISGW